MPRVCYIFACYLGNALLSLKKQRVRINEQIKASELRLIGADGANFGVVSIDEALEKAREQELDLIEISPDAEPPVAKITDYGKFQYEQKKKQRAAKAKAHTTETKTIQVKIGTGEHDKMLKAKRVAEWLGEGHRVKIDLFLWGRYKYKEFSFLKEQLEGFLQLIPAEYSVADEIKKGPKGLTVTIERAKGGKKKEEEKKEASETEKGDTDQNQ